MQVFEKAKDYEFLGREFLVWMWFRSDVRGEDFTWEKRGTRN